ncbi:MULTISPECIES: hypothetical protein [unclassified Streptomyces]|uniref:hypothetical protein n=1 Tax=unclassified Streptomyces TaxID=2593676 RepID=UPI002E337225|nr:hypothetical protein [Streptomyces sp. NBC_01356]WTB39606.1 hypothetical protein OG569_17195 [Streptomyces sp. NBC_00827]
MAESEAKAAAAAVSEQKPVEPRGGAGIFDVDPDQTKVSQDPKVVVKGDIAVFPENGGL